MLKNNICDLGCEQLPLVARTHLALAQRPVTNSQTHQGLGTDEQHTARKSKKSRLFPKTGNKYDQVHIIFTTTFTLSLTESLEHKQSALQYEEFSVLL